MRLPLISLLLALGAGSAAACPAPPKAGRVETYPTAADWPANLLRFYIYFPRPMARGDILDHLALVDETGREVPGALLENRYDLWSPDATRLTVLRLRRSLEDGLAGMVRIAAEPRISVFSPSRPKIPPGRCGKR